MSRRRKIQSREPVVCEIESLSHDGRGIARLEGKTQFVDAALPGEKVQARYVNSHRRYDELVTQEVLESHEDRTTPPCPHAGICGGCSMQHATLPFQIQHKEDVLLEQLEHFGAQQPEQVAPPLCSEGGGYRSKARLGVRYVRKREEVLVGFREKHSNFLTAIDSCYVLDPRVGQKITELKTLVRDLSCYDRIPQIEVSCGDTMAALIIRHMEPLTDADLDLLRQFAQQHDFWIYLQPKGPDTVHKLWPEDDAVLHYELPQENLSLNFTPTDFIQVNRPLNRAMLQQAMDWLAPESTDRVLDLFCGLGNFTLPLARRVATVVGVEGSDAMVKRGYQNAKANGIDNCQFFAADLHLPSIADKQHSWQSTYDKILLDPPRSGAEEIARNIGQFGAARILYVSCNPATLARDAGILAQQGYRLVKAGVMDMFPHTAHVESMALFEKE